MKKKNIAWIFVAAVLMLVATIAITPYIKAEYLTARYGEQFAGLEQQTNMLDGATYFKVLSYSETEAKVFYVSDTGDVITFAKNPNGRWTMRDWHTVWSESGSADNLFWPYYR